MAIDFGYDSGVLTRPGQVLQPAGVQNRQIGHAPDGTNPAANYIEEYSGIVEGTIARESIMTGFVPTISVRGTDTVSKFRIGEATLQKLVPGEAPKGTVVQANKAKVTVDTVVLARNTIPMLDDFQNSYNARREVAVEHGKKIAKFRDQALLIQAIKSARISNTSNAAGYPAGWNPGSKFTFAAANDEKDPAKVLQAFAELFTMIEEKDIDPIAAGMMAVVKPAAYYTLLQNDAIIDREYIMSDGTNIKTKALAAYGVPVRVSNNLPTAKVENHFLSNAGNGDAYDGDFSKVYAAVFSPRAVLAGETIALTSKVWFDDNTKVWNVDDWLSFGATTDNPAFAGVIEKA